MHQKCMALAVHQSVLVAIFRDREGFLGCCAAARVCGHENSRALASVDGSSSVPKSGRASNLEARVNIVTMKSKMRDAIEAPPDTLAGIMRQLRHWEP